MALKAATLRQVGVVYDEGKFSLIFYVSLIFFFHVRQFIPAVQKKTNTVQLSLATFSVIGFKI